LGLERDEGWQSVRHFQPWIQRLLKGIHPGKKKAAEATPSLTQLSQNPMQLVYLPSALHAALSLFQPHGSHQPNVNASPSLVRPAALGMTG
jgi:hypothetical protein